MRPLTTPKMVIGSISMCVCCTNHLDGSLVALFFACSSSMDVWSIAMKQSFSSLTSKNSTKPSETNDGKSLDLFLISSMWD